MKIVFLDIDGVLVTANSMLAKPSLMSHLEPACVELLNKLCLEQGLNNCRVVISSSWRNLFSVSEIVNHLKQAKFNPDFIHHDWSTVCLLNGTRGDEIAVWLKQHAEVNDFVIIDDDNDFLPSQLCHHVQTDFADGFCESHLEQALNILGTN